MKTKKKDITICSVCKKKVIPQGIGTGYGINEKNEKICYECCGIQDRKTLLETGKLDGYYSKYVFSNWPGTFKVVINKFSYSHHNFAGRFGRVDFWFSLGDQNFHGVHIGNNNECARVRRVK